MKKQSAMLALLLVWLFAGLGTGQAQTTAEEKEPVPLVAKLKLVQMSDSQYAEVRDVKRTSGKVNGRVLQSLEILIATEEYGLVHIGEKWPLIYYDPRAEQFQIQYVDVGGKFDVKFSQVGPDAVSMEARPEISTLQRLKVFGDVKRLEAYPETFPLITELKVPYLKFGETLVMASYHGPAARKFLTTVGQPTDNDNLVFLVELERP